MRNSFSKILPKRDIPRTTPSEHNSTTPSKYEEDLSGPENEKVVIESMKKGMPLIPFSCPTYHLAEKRTELSKIHARKDLIRKRQY